MMTTSTRVEDARLTTEELKRAFERSDGLKGKLTIDAEKAHAMVSELLELREAVKPFAALGQYVIDEDFQTKPDDRTIWGFDRHELTYGDFRRAARSLSQGAGHEQ